ncbi:MAG: hypothetical protein ACLQME_24285 [Alphaproteobacteria bacterium]
MTLIKARNALALLAALLFLSGQSTYLQEKQCAMTNCLQPQIYQKQQEYNAAVQQNSDLKAQLASLQQQQAELATDLNREAAALQQLGLRLDQSRSATEAQRQAYQRLDEKRRQLQKELDRAKADPPPQNATDADAKQLQLDALGEEKASLNQQIKTLSDAL